jgi:hypothetical protein
MVGHGGPKTSQGCRLPTAWAAVAARVYAGALGLLLALAAEALMADDMRVRIAWGGGSDRVWQGTISISDGSLAEAQPLGVEADEPGSMWLAGDAAGSQKLVIHQRSPRGYDGVDVLVTAAPTAKLRVHFSAADDAARVATVETSLADLSGEGVNKELDNHGNRLLLMRAPGDSLRVSLARDSLVFAPGELLKFTLTPHALPLAEDGRARIKVQLLGAGGKELRSQQHDVSAGREEKIPLEINLPNEEGVYDVAIVAVNNPSLSQAVRQPLNWKRTIAERRVQLLVLGSRQPAGSRADHELAPVVEIDPANPRWFEKLNKLPQLQLAKTARLPRLWKGPLGNECLQMRPHPLGELAQLNPNADSPDVSWEAYWLPIAQPGRPHVLEVDYPNDVPQTLGISILEPNAAGAIVPIGLDSGVDCGTEAVGGAAAPHWQRHRLIFWPRTTAPLLLMTNGRERAPAVYGKIRVLAAGERLSRLLPDRVAAKGRLLAAYLDRPLLAANFSANQCLDLWSGRSLDDWWTFYEGGSRLIEYLHHAGYNGLMLGVLADGSTIYPSAVVSPTPRYDTGALFATAQDPVRKDVLEMLLRLFDREALQLIPSVEFAAPLPELEAIRRGGGPAAQGIEWIGADGAGWCASSPAQRGLAPYYNVLHPRVQQAMLGVLRELAERYAQHPSFAGLAMRLSADGYAQLPGPDWGLDDVTIGQFERDTQLQVPGRGPQRFAERAAYLAQEPHRRTWLEWRAAQLSKFYHRAYDELVAVRPDSRLFLAGAGLIGGADLQSELRPTLPQRTTVATALLRVGIDTRQYQGHQQQIILLRPERVLPEANLSARAADLELGQMGDFDRCFQTGAAGSLFFHQPREVRIESFDQKSPFKPSYTWLVSQPVPSGQQNRRRLVHSLATLDAQVMIDGGWLLPMGQEESTRELVAAYRLLPSIRFQPVGNRQANDAAQPVTFRSGTQQGGRTYLYVVNDAPFGTTARVHVEAGRDCRIEELTGMRKIGPLQPDASSGMNWEVRLEPYDLMAVRVSEPNVQFSNPQATWPDTVERALGSQIRQLGARAAALRNPPPLDVLTNPGFERPLAGDGPIPNWAVSVRSGVRIQLDKAQKHGGRQSVHMASTGPVACLVSRPLAPPATGRLSMAVWLRVGDVNRQPPLRLALDGKLRGRDYYRFAPIGLAPGAGQPSVPIGSQWGQYVFQVDDLPLEGLASLRVRLDLMGTGEVWVDDVQLFNLAFSKPELVELSKLITLADVKLQNGQVGDCMRLLEGYWPRFLQENVPLPAGAAQLETIATKPRPAEEPPPERTGWLNRVKDWVPESLRF